MRSVRLSLALLLCAGACASGQDDAGDEDVVALDPAKADRAAAVALPTPGDSAAHLYYDYPDSATIDANVAYRVFTARAHHEFVVGARGDVPVGFKMARLARHANGAYFWRPIARVDGPDGHAELRWTGARNYTYLLDVGAASATQVEIDLGCSGGDHSLCALAPQPGDACGRCDTGAYCQFPAGTCGDGVDGSCVVVPTDVCPKLGLVCHPVCGCDGQTYCADLGCPIAAAQTSIDHDGACSCDYEEADLGDATLARTWVDGSGTLSYTLSANGPTFELISDPCADRPGCAAPTSRFTGVWTVSGSSVTLDFDHAARPSETYLYEQDCNGAERLFQLGDRGTILTPR